MDFYPILKNIHSYNRYALLLVITFVLVRSLMGWLGKGRYEKLDSATGGAMLGLAHLQLLLGLILYFISPYAMKGSLSPDNLNRAWVVYFKMEHITAMIVAVALIQVGRTASKRATDDVSKHKKVAIYTLIAVVLIVGSLAHKGLLLGNVPV